MCLDSCFFRSRKKPDGAADGDITVKKEKEDPESHPSTENGVELKVGSPPREGMEEEKAAAVKKERKSKSPERKKRKKRSRSRSR
jgi:hypothetical protein